MRLALAAAAVFFATAPGKTPGKVVRDGYSLALPAGWTESAKLAEASKDRLSPNADGGVAAWERPEAGAIARVIWLRSKHPSGVGVREELEALHDVFKGESDGARVVSWDVAEDKVLMRSTLVYRTGDPLEGKGKTVRQVSVAGVDREGKIRAWTLECGFPSSAGAKAEADCEALGKSFAATVPAKELRAIEPKKSP